MEIKTQIKIMKDKEYDFNPQKKWVSVDSVWKFWKDFYHPETADCCEESLERFEDRLKKELEEK